MAMLHFISRGCDCMEAQQKSFNYGHKSVQEYVCILKTSFIYNGKM